ncbi:MAG: hypothetical protein ABI813_04780 [Bacteroidota bacterium]
MKDEQPIINFNYQLEEQEKTVQPTMTGTPAPKSYFRIHSFPVRTNDTGNTYTTKKQENLQPWALGK